ncbi:MAG: hypothetical protein ACRDPO_00305 [Streptosporangiaceae bacterium]
METLADLRVRRAIECRLAPGRELRSLTEAGEFLDERGLLTRTPDCALPSLYEACQEEPYRAGGHGFASWPATKWPWFGELAERDYLVTAIHRGKNLLLTDAVARLIDPIARAEIARWHAADRGAARLLDHLAAAGPSELDDLRTELGMSRDGLRSLRAPLERSGAIIARSADVTAGEGHLHTSELFRWDQAYPDSRDTDTTPARALADLVVAGVRAAVVVPESEPRKWFAWPSYWHPALMDDLIREGRLRQVEGFICAGSLFR